MSLFPMLFLAYIAAGAVTAVAFAVVAAPRLLSGAPPVSVGARLLLMPGAFLLWPLVLHRWMSRGASAHGGTAEGETSRDTLEPHS